MNTIDFVRSYFRFYLDFEARQAESVSHQPPTRTNRVRISLESTCTLTHTPTRETRTYALTAACRTERVGGEKGELWLMPSAHVVFVCSDDGMVSVLKSWHKNDPGVMLYPPSLGPQPERQTFAVGENFDEADIDLVSIEAKPLTTFEAAAEAIAGTSPIVSRIEYQDGDYGVCVEQPVKTINIAERDGLHQTDTGPIILPDLSPARLSAVDVEIDVFDLAFSAWHRPDWAEFVIRQPTKLSGGISVNHYSATRHVEPTRNLLLSAGEA